MFLSQRKNKFTLIYTGSYKSLFARGHGVLGTIDRLRLRRRGGA